MERTKCKEILSLMKKTGCQGANGLWIKVFRVGKGNGAVVRGVISCINVEFFGGREGSEHFGF